MGVKQPKCSSLCFISIQEQEPVSGASKISHVHPRTIFCAGMHIGRNAWASEGRQLDGEGCRTVHVFIRSLIFLCLFFHSGSSSCPLIFDLLRPVQLLDPVLSTCSCSTGTKASSRPLQPDTIQPNQGECHVVSSYLSPATHLALVSDLTVLEPSIQEIHFVQLTNVIHIHCPTPEPQIIGKTK